MHLDHLRRREFISLLGGRMAARRARAANAAASRPAEWVVGFCNEPGTWKRRIKKGKDAIKWTPLSGRTFEVNAVRLSCGKAGNAQIFKPVRAASSERRHQGGQPC